jgi:hypothetical protein
VALLILALPCNAAAAELARELPASTRPAPGKLDQVTIPTVYGWR